VCGGWSPVAAPGAAQSVRLGKCSHR
jgi:hypothetical protein